FHFRQASLLPAAAVCHFGRAETGAFSQPTTRVHAFHPAFAEETGECGHPIVPAASDRPPGDPAAMSQRPTRYVRGSECSTFLSPTWHKRAPINRCHCLRRRACRRPDRLRRRKQRLARAHAKQKKSSRDSILSLPPSDRGSS